MSGRPNEGRVPMTIHVLPLAETRINFLRDKSNPALNTQGKVVESLLGVRTSKNVAGAGRKAPRDQHGRAKQKQSRAKRANS
jgi:hypothetical protein